MISPIPPPPCDPVPIFAAHGLTLVPASPTSWHVKEFKYIHFVARYTRRWEFSVKRGERWKIRKTGKRAQTIAKHVAAVLKWEAEELAGLEGK